MDILIKIFPAGTAQNDIEAPSAAPFIAVINNSPEEDIYYLIIENKILNADIKNIRYAVEVIVAAYFVFNIEYPLNISQSLEAIQKSFFDIELNFLIIF